MLLAVKGIAAEVVRLLLLALSQILLMLLLLDVFGPGTMLHWLRYHGGAAFAFQASVALAVS